MLRLQGLVSGQVVGTVIKNHSMKPLLTESYFTQTGNTVVRG